MPKTCRICGTELEKENLTECVNCGKEICKECAVFDKPGATCKKCIKENKIPEINWK